MPDAPFLVTAVTVTAVERLCPTFVRIELGAPELADFGTDGPLYDQRIKVVFPGASGRLPDLTSAGGDWFDAWLDLPDEERGAMRTYSVRDVRGRGSGTRLVVDFVLHLAPGATGPASSWAATAAVGDRVLVVGPRRGTPPSGIEFRCDGAERVLLSGDETAVPAICRILADLPAHTLGAAFLEVPHPADVLPVTAPAGVAVTWLPRAGEAVGARLVPAVVGHLGGRAANGSAARGYDEPVADEVWETPGYSGSGEPLVAGPGIPGLYAWIAGESRVVTTLRRHLVRDLGVDRSQVAFMGYWREGVAMRG